MSLLLAFALAASFALSVLVVGMCIAAARSDRDADRLIEARRQMVGPRSGGSTP